MLALDQYTALNYAQVCFLLLSCWKPSKFLLPPPPPRPNLPKNPIILRTTQWSLALWGEHDSWSVTTIQCNHWEFVTLGKWMEGIPGWESNSLLFVHGSPVWYFFFSNLGMVLYKHALLTDLDTDTTSVLWQLIFSNAKYRIHSYIKNKLAAIWHSW